MPKFKLPRIKLNWWLAAIILVGSLTIGLIVWRVASHTPAADAAAGDAPSVRATNSGWNPYTSTKTLKSAPRPAYEAGDIIMIFLASDYGLHPDLTVPDDFTEIGRRAYGENLLAYVVAYKIATSNEPSSYSYYVPAYADNLYSVMSIKDADSSVAPALTSTLTPGSTSSHAAPSVYPIGSNDLLLSTVTLDSANLSPNVTWAQAPGMTKHSEHQAGAYIAMLIASEPLINTGETGYKTHRPSGVNSADPGIGYGITIKGTRDSVTTVVPDGTLTGNTWTGTHTNIDEPGLPDTASLVAGTNQTAKTGDFTFQNPTISKPVDYVQLKVCAHSFTSAVGTIQDDLGIQLSIDGAVQDSETITPVFSGSGAATSCKVYTFTYYGSWTQTQLANMQVDFTQKILGTSTGNKATNADDIRIEYARVRVISHDAHVETRPLTTTPTVRDIKSASIASTTTTKSVARPTTQQGDLLIAILGVDKGGLHEANLPSGFTEVSWLDGYVDDINTATTMARAKVGIKVATSSEPTSYSYSVNSTANSRIDIVSVAGADTSVAPTVGRRMTPKSATSHRAPSIYPPGRADLLLSTVIKSPISSTGVTWTPPGGMTERSDAYVASGLTMTTASEALTHGDKTGFKEFTQTTGSNYIAASFNMAIKGTQIVSSSQDQSSYRFFNKATDGSTGSPLAAQNTVASTIAGYTYRLRQLIRQAEGTTATTDAYKLQAAEKSSTCSASPFSDLTTVFDTGTNDSLMSDDFAAQDTAKWTFGAQANVSGGQAVFPVLNSTQQQTMIANSGYDFTGATATIELTQLLNKRTSEDLSLRLTNSAGDQNALWMTVYNNSYLRMVERVNGTNDIASVSFDAVAHRWLRIREAAGVVYWETSPDNVTWTIRRQKTLALTNVTSMVPGVYAGHGNLSGDTDVGTATVDNFSLRAAGVNIDESAISSTPNDPTPVSGAVIPQRISNNVSFGVQTSIAAGENGLWEFALKSDETMAGKTYCFRVVKSDGTQLATYSQYPEISFTAAAPAGATLDQQLRGGQSVVNGQKNPFTW